MRVHDYSKPVLRLSAVRSRIFRNLFDEYERRLLRTGSTTRLPDSISTPSRTVGVWLEHRRLTTVDEETLSVFEGHRSTCRCPGTSRNRHGQVVACVRRFLRYLCERGVVPIVEARPQPVRLVEGFLQWMKVHRGVVETTLTSSGRYACPSTSAA